MPDEPDSPGKRSPQRRRKLAKTQKDIIPVEPVVEQAEVEHDAQTRVYFQKSFHLARSHQWHDVSSEVAEMRAVRDLIREQLSDDADTYRFASATQRLLENYERRLETPYPIPATIVLAGIVGLLHEFQAHVETAQKLFDMDRSITMLIQGERKTAAYTQRETQGWLQSFLLWFANTLRSELAAVHIEDATTQIVLRRLEAEVTQYLAGQNASRR